MNASESRSEDSHGLARLLDALETIRTDWTAPLAPLRAVRAGIGARPVTGFTPPPVPPALTDARTAVAETLFEWCALLVDQRALTHASVHRDDVPGMTHLLARHAEWWERHDAFDDMLAETERVARRLHSILAPPRRILVRIGSCPLPIDDRDTPCDGLVLADPATGRARCRWCGADGTIDEWRAVLAVPQLVTVRELARIAAYEGITVTEGAVRALIDRGEIESAERDSRGRRLVRRDDAVEILRGHERRRHSI